MTYKQRQNKWLKDNNIQNGDRIFVYQRLVHRHRGWLRYWFTSSDKFVGQWVKLVNSCGSLGMYVETSTGYRDYISVDCVSTTEQPITQPNIKLNENYNAVKIGNRWYCTRFGELITRKFVRFLLRCHRKSNYGFFGEYKGYFVEIRQDSTHVGCQSFTIEALQELYKRMEE